jgi:tetratricopeptide (TPR) repeat protein/tRNA A-37 threonylcarbamoyl transferase component Bud32
MNCPECAAPLAFRARRCPSCQRTVDLTSITTVSGHAPRLEHPSLEFPPGTLLAERFKILEKAGAGGMGTVYKAFDTALVQEVALKLIRSDLADDELFSDRFKQEVKLTRRITHANVCRVHDLGESHGLLFLSMEWLEGENLKDRLRSDGTVSVERALEIAEAITRALEAAHAQGIVHRDLKPSNVILGKDGSVHVMDFGIAVGPGVAAEPPSGTPAYMSPEQWRGERPDARSDLFSLGLILLEMLGHEPTSPEERVLPRLPAPLQRQVGALLESLLEEEQEARCPSAEEALARIRRIRAASSGPQGISRWGSFFWGGRRRRILSGLALLAVVSCLGYLFVRSRARGIQDGQEQQASPAWSYYQTGMQYLRDEETVRTIEDAIHMLHRATEADPRFAPAWAHLGEAYWRLYEETRTASSKEEALLAVSKAQQLAPDLPEVQYTAGRGLIAEKKFQEGRQALEEVVKRDPKMDVAWAGLEVAYRELNDYARGLGAIQTAIKLNPQYFRHQVYLAKFLYTFGEFNRAILASRKALELNPNSLSAWDMLIASYLSIGHPQDAAVALVEAIKIEENAGRLSNLGTVYYNQGEYEDAMKSYRRATELEPMNADHWGNLGDALTMLKKPEEAHTAYLQAAEAARAEAERVPTDPRAHLMLGLYCARARDKQCAISEGQRAVAMQPGNSAFWFRMAIIHTIFVEIDQALDCLEKAVKLGLTRSEIQNDPDLIPLHGNPRYQKILDLAS